MSHRSIRRRVMALLAALPGASAARPGVSPVESTPPASRGELLYAIHCIECHNARIHWRDRRVARDWPTLEAEVDRWQRAARLGWGRGDVRAVTRYLGDKVYRLPRPQRRAVSSAGTGAEEPPRTPAGGPV